MATIPATPRTKAYTIQIPIAGPFLVGFRLLATASLDVYVNGLPRTDWTLQSVFSNGFDDNATITFAGPLAINDKLVIDGDLIPDRQTELIADDPRFAILTNSELTRLTASVIEVREQVKRAVRGLIPVEPTENITPASLSGFGTAVSAAAASAASAAASSAAAASARDIALAALADLEAMENILPGLRSNWATATAYIRGDIVSINGGSEICLSAHTSGVFDTDRANGFWQNLASRGASGAGTGDLMAAQNLNDLTSKSTARANLELGSIATQAAGAVAITGGSIAGINDLAVVDGGTGASTPAQAQANLQVPPALRQIATSGLATGGGNLTADRVINVPPSSNAQALEGTDDTTAMTPLRVAEAIAANSAPAISAGEVVISYLTPPNIPLALLSAGFAGSASGTLQTTFAVNLGVHTVIKAGTLRLKGTTDGTLRVYINGVLAFSPVSTFSQDITVAAGDVISFGGTKAYSFGSNGGTVIMNVTNLRVCGNAARPWRL